MPMSFCDGRALEKGSPACPRPSPAAGAERPLKPGHLKPGHLAFVGSFESFELAFQAKREGNLVASRQQTLLAERVDFEGVLSAIRARHALLLQIDANARSRSVLQHGHHGLEHRSLQ